MFLNNINFNEITLVYFFIFFERYPAYVLLLALITNLMGELFLSFATFAGLYFSFQQSHFYNLFVKLKV